MADIKNIAIIGAGQMGCGIAHVFALAGYRVLLNDINAAQLSAGLAIIEKNLARQVASEKITQSAFDAALALISTHSELAALADADLVIEAASEDENIKLQILEAVSALVSDDTLLASNTSSISITRLAAQTRHPENFIGMHFMNPVPVMQLVELIRGMATSDESFETAHAIVQKLGKTAAVSEDYPAFIVNRILLPMINEAAFALYEGVGTVASIDEAMQLGANHRMGPLQLADFIGLDTCVSIMRVLQDGLGDDKYRPCPLLVKYVEAGWLGRKSGRGFYDYGGDSPIPTR
ncbi:MAG: 3-hydroxybutyryl-CoA dehydrogenase [Rhodobiaceae bacterium]|nr:3-hydroxybutyryl-CoA dehydrogenase [Rhodobiaceae bacterium]